MSSDFVATTIKGNQQWVIDCNQFLTDKFTCKTLSGPKFSPAPNVYLTLEMDITRNLSANFFLRNSCSKENVLVSVFSVRIGEKVLKINSNRLLVMAGDRGGQLKVELTSLLYTPSIDFVSIIQ
jgi:hypothetical protein